MPGPGAAGDLRLQARGPRRRPGDRLVPVRPAGPGPPPVTRSPPGRVDPEYGRCPLAAITMPLAGAVIIPAYESESFQSHRPRLRLVAAATVISTARAPGLAPAGPGLGRAVPGPAVSWYRDIVNPYSATWTLRVGRVWPRERRRFTGRVTNFTGRSSHMNHSKMFQQANLNAKNIYIKSI